MTKFLMKKNERKKILTYNKLLSDLSIHEEITCTLHFENL